MAVEMGGIPLAVLPAPANHRDDGLLAETLDAIGVVGPLPARPVMHLDAGYDYQPCRQVLAVRAWWVRSLLVACQPRFRLVAGG